ncbi:DNA cytosine methyltransferase [Bacillus sp. FSL R7-0685]|uniref:DNA cytosine methyltransferase n=1 Tax=Bacillus sp. FSL R7-0685 TaxID=2921589 RepID=UPI0030FCCCF2
MKLIAVDLFCGVGGLTHGVQKTGINVAAGIDIDETCKYSFEFNNNSTFINKSVSEITSKELLSFYGEDTDTIKVLMGCAPCQPFSTYTRKKNKENTDSRWGLLYSFASLIEQIKPEIVSMENVPSITKETVFKDFVENLENQGYFVHWKVVFCPDYGVPQNRKRLILLASKIGKISLIPPTHTKENYVTVKDVIGNLPEIEAGEVHKNDSLHRSSKLSEKNLLRIQQSKPGGTWRDWDKELISSCHKKKSGSSYGSVYGRMEWTKPSPTITTQFYGYGNGRFGHPVQNRAISLREGALLQTFPKEYIFNNPEQEISLKKTGTHIGNAVPVRLGEVIGMSIINSIKESKYDCSKV